MEQHPIYWSTIFYILSYRTPDRHLAWLFELEYKMYDQLSMESLRQ